MILGISIEEYDIYKCQYRNVLERFELWDELKTDQNSLQRCAIWNQMMKTVFNRLKMCK